MLRILHCLYNRLADGCKVVSPAHRSLSAPKKYYFSVSGTDLCFRLSKLQGLVRAEGLGKFKNSLTSSDLEPATIRIVA
jgi:hypothetical protein